MNLKLQYSIAITICISLLVVLRITYRLNGFADKNKKSPMSTIFYARVSKHECIVICIFLFYSMLQPMFWHLKHKYTTFWMEFLQRNWYTVLGFHVARIFYRFHNIAQETKSLHLRLSDLLGLNQKLIHPYLSPSREKVWFSVLVGARPLIILVDLFLSECGILCNFAISLTNIFFFFS